MINTHNFSTIQVDLLNQAVDQRLDVLYKALADCEAKRKLIDDKLACNEYEGDIDAMIQRMHSYERQAAKLTEMIDLYEKTKKGLVVNDEQ